MNKTIWLPMTALIISIVSLLYTLPNYIEMNRNQAEVQIQLDERNRLSNEQFCSELKKFNVTQNMNITSEICKN